MLVSGEHLQYSLDCEYKTFLAMQGETGVPHAYQTLMHAKHEEYRNRAEKHLLLKHKCGSAPSQLSIDDLQHGSPLIFDTTLNDGRYTFRFDALEKAPGRSFLGDFHYRPVLFHLGETVPAGQRMLLAFGSKVLSSVQGYEVTGGRIVYGSTPAIHTARRAPIHGKLELAAERLRQMASFEYEPKLRLNRHCEVCQFRDRCRREAIEKDDLSLLRGMSDRAMNEYRSKGIFTVEQLSYTFRPRRRPKHLRERPLPYQPGLHALAIRERKTYVLNRPQVPTGETRVYVDLEGGSDASSIYLIGALAVANEKSHYRSFWADERSQEEVIVTQFYDWLSSLGDVRVFHYGSYESKAFRRWATSGASGKTMKSVMDRSVNVLNLIYSQVYFPTYSNGLKEIGEAIGCTWPAGLRSGLDAVVLRECWQDCRDSALKDQLIHYNECDCRALGAVTAFLAQLADENASHDAASTDELLHHEDFGRWGRRQFSFDAFRAVADSAYFDYQRSKIFLRTDPSVKKALSRRRKRKANTNRPNKTVDLKARKCWRCKGADIRRDETRIHSKLQLDLRISSSGIRRWIVRYRTPFHRCSSCRTPFFPRVYKQKEWYGHNLMVWGAYQQVVNRMALSQIHIMLKECFGLHVDIPRLHGLRASAANYYKPTYNLILKNLLEGPLIHADETKIKLRSEIGYVWVLANMNSVFYLYRPTRQCSFLPSLLDGFQGVLVSDFYAGYDSLPCPQQKCLVHLMWDINADLLKNPFDEELQQLALRFGEELRAIIKTADRHGLKARFFARHRKSIDCWYRELVRTHFSSQKAEHYQGRLLRYKDKLFTFLGCDGVPWNNNNAEHAIKPLAKYRRVFGKAMEAKGLQAYLVMLSIYQTCEYRGASFFDFLTSRQRDVEKYCEVRG